MSSAKPSRSPLIQRIPVHTKLLRGALKPRVALVGRVGVGKHALFARAASPTVQQGTLEGIKGAYEKCTVNVGLEQIELITMPSLEFLHHSDTHDQSVFLHLLWGARWPHTHITEDNTTFAAPDVLIHVIDATALGRDLELSLEMALLGRPVVIALNRIDEARHKGLFINIKALAKALDMPVIPTIAHMGKGVAALFEAALDAVRQKACPLPQAPTPYIDAQLLRLKTLLADSAIDKVFRAPRALILSQIAQNNAYFTDIFNQQFPQLTAPLKTAICAADAALPRVLSEEIHADRHHRAATLYESVTTPRSASTKAGWRMWLDKFFLHPRWGLIGCVLVFAFVLLIVFELSSRIDALTAARLAEWLQTWQPDSTLGVVGHAVLDGLIGLISIAIPYMLPLVLLLVLLEESGLMYRVAFVVDRGFHHIGLHGGVALPFLISLGCNVPAISTAARMGSRHERLIAAILITFVPCSARSAILLAVGGKYLGGLGVLTIFALTLSFIALLGNWLAKRYADSAPGLIQQIPPYALPHWGTVWRKTWERTSDIVTIVTPLLVIGSMVLALLTHIGADALINTALTPITVWWLGLPVVLGVPILFGVLRKELSLLMIYQALGTQEIVPQLSPAQIFTFLVFLTFYIPCLSTFAVMLKTLGRKEAWFSVLISICSALLIAGTIRAFLEVAQIARTHW